MDHRFDLSQTVICHSCPEGTGELVYNTQSPLFSSGLRRWAKDGSSAFSSAFPRLFWRNAAGVGNQLEVLDGRLVVLAEAIL